MNRLRFFFRHISQSTWVHFCTVLLIFVLMFCFAMIQGGFISWFIFYAFLPVAVYTIVLMICPVNHIQAERTVLNAQLFAGDAVHIRLKLKRKHAFPPCLMTVTDGSAHQVDRVQTDTVFWFGKDAVFSYTMEHVRRGRYVLSELVLTMEDPLGFFRRRVSIACDTMMLVYPVIRPIGLPETGLGRHLFHYSGENMDLSQFSGVRDYRPSDRLSWLDWKSTARGMNPVTKLFEPERPHHASVTLVLQASDSDAVFERGISFTVSLVDMLLSHGFTVRLACSSIRTPLYVREDTKYEREEVYRLLAMLTREEALKADNVPIMNNRETEGFVVSSDPGIAGFLINAKRSLKQAQTLFLIAEDTAPELERAASSLTLYLVHDDQFTGLLKVGGKDARRFK